MKRFMVAALVALALAGCTLPSQDLAPGVAFSYHGNVATNTQIDDLARSWDPDGDGVAIAFRRNALTLELLADDLLAKADELTEGQLAITETIAREQATKWLAVKEDGGEPSPELVRSFRIVLALYVVYTFDVDGSVLADIAQKVEQEAIVSPRSGVFSADAFLASTTTAAGTAYNWQQTASTPQEQELAYVAFATVNGFGDPASGVRTTGGASS